MRPSQLMVFEQLLRYAGLAVGLKPSATECEGRLRWRERSNCSKTISPRLWDAKAACAGESRVIAQRPYARLEGRGYERLDASRLIAGNTRQRPRQGQAHKFTIRLSLTATVPGIGTIGGLSDAYVDPILTIACS